MQKRARSLQTRSVEFLPTLTSLKSRSRNTYDSSTVQTITVMPSKPKRVASTITIEDINPELAAKIVKHHILPMFDKRPAKGTIH
jgi:hypothetical protein